MAYLKQTLGVIIGVGQVLADSLCPFPGYEMAAYRGAEGVTLHVHDDAVRLIAQEGYDPEYGARPVKRALQNMLLNDLSRSLLAGTVSNQRPILVTTDDGKLKFGNE